MPKKKEVKQTEINLLPQEGFEYTTTGRVLGWVLSTFRYIVIVTELIVMVAFFSRFWFDAYNSDLSDEIKSSQEIISSNSEFEEKYRDLQARIKFYNELKSNQKKFSGFFPLITKNLPPDIILETLTFDKNGVMLTGFTPNEISILQTIVNIESQTEFNDTALTQIDTGIKGGVIKFTINSHI